MGMPAREGEFTSSIRRCQHGVFTPTDVRSNAPNPCCSLCVPFTVQGVTKKEARQRASEASLKAIQNDETDLGFVVAASSMDEVNMSRKQRRG